MPLSWRVKKSLLFGFIGMWKQAYLHVTSPWNRWIYVQEGGEAAREASSAPQAPLKADASTADVPDQDETPAVNPAKQGEVKLCDMQVRPSTYNILNSMSVAVRCHGLIWPPVWTLNLWEPCMREIIQCPSWSQPEAVLTLVSEFYFVPFGTDLRPNGATLNRCLVFYNWNLKKSLSF